MNIEPKQPTRKAPDKWFTGDVYIDAIHARKPEPSRMACGCVHFTPGARTAWHSHALGQTLLITEGTADGDGAAWLEHVTDERYQAAAEAAETS